MLMRPTKIEGLEQAQPPRELGFLRPTTQTNVCLLEQAQPSLELAFSDASGTNNKTSKGLRISLGHKMAI